MAAFPQAFTVGAQAAMSGGVSVPPGYHVMAITASDIKETSNKKGHYLELEFTGLADEGKGLKAWSRLNVNNQTAKAVELAFAELESICRAIGLPDGAQINDSTMLHDKPLLVKVDGDLNNKGKLSTTVDGGGYHPAGTVPSTLPAVKPYPVANEAPDHFTSPSTGQEPKAAPFGGSAPAPAAGGAFGGQAPAASANGTPSWAAGNA